VYDGEDLIGSFWLGLSQSSAQATLALVEGATDHDNRFAVFTMEMHCSSLGQRATFVDPTDRCEDEEMYRIDDYHWHDLDGTIFSELTRAEALIHPRSHDAIEVMDRIVQGDESLRILCDRLAANSSRSSLR